MNPSQIELLIESANQLEAETQALLDKLEGELSELPAVIALPQSKPAEALREFVVEYINHVPAFLSAVSYAAKDAGIEAYVMPFLEVATNYFLEPTETPQGDGGLETLMQQAYLANRLIEEVNDQYIVRAGIPLIPMDMTKANIIVHQLIGDTLANSLDAIVEETAERMTGQDSVYSSERFKAYVETRKGKGWDQVWKQWSDMTHSLSVDLSFNQELAKTSLGS